MVAPAKKPAAVAQKIVSSAPAKTAPTKATKPALVPLPVAPKKPIAKATKVVEPDVDGVEAENAGELKSGKANPFAIRENSARQVSIRVIKGMTEATDIKVLVDQFRSEREDIDEVKARQHIILTRAWLIKKDGVELPEITGCRQPGVPKVKLTDEEKAARKAARKAAKNGGEDGVTAEEEVAETSVENVEVEEA
jgi:hypothetical protein